MQLIVGWGLTGQAIYDYLKTHVSEPILIFDENITLQKISDLPVLTVGHLDVLIDFLPLVKIAYVSPGISPSHSLIFQLIRHRISVKTDIDLFLETLKPKQKLIGVTGTNGKSTVVSLIDHILTLAGVRSVVTSNYGQSVLKDLSDDLEVYILELSSFQLYWSNPIPLDVALLTNMEQDHLDWHGFLEHYEHSKYKIFKKAKCKILGDVKSPELIHCGFVRRLLNAQVCIRDQAFFLGNQRMVGLKDTPFNRTCDQLNALLALQAIELFHIDLDILRQALGSFSLLPYRGAYVLHKLGIDWFNDSKSTNLHATIKCLEALKGRSIVLMLGGDAKSQDWSGLSQLKDHSVHCVIGFGKDGLMLQKYVEDFSNFQYAKQFDDAFLKASRAAKTGDCVVLSPACASLDAFDSYIERGQAFDQLVHAL